MRAGIFGIVLALLFGPSSTLSAEPARVVRLVWFPRFSPDSKLLATAHGSWEAKEGGEVRIWDAETGKRKHTLKQPRGIRSVAFAPKGQLLAAGGYGGSIAVFNPETGQLVREGKTSLVVEVVEFHPGGRDIFAAHGDGSIRLWNVESLQEAMPPVPVHKGEIWGMTASPDGKLVATAGQDGRVCITDIAAGKIRHQFQHPGCNGVAFSSDGKRLAAGCGDGVIRIYGVEDGQEMLAIKGHQSRSVADVQFGANDTMLVSAGFDKTVRVWDLRQPASPVLKKTFPAHQQFAFGVALSPDGKLLASGGWDDRIHVWDVESFAEKWSWRRSDEPN